MPWVLYLGLKCWRFLVKAAAGNPQRVQRSLGFEGVVWLLQSLEGDEAVALLRGMDASIGQHVRWSRGIVLHADREAVGRLSIGDHCHLGREVLLDLTDSLTIGARVTISMRCVILTHTDAGDSRCGLVRQRKGVIVEDDAYIGAGVTILPGVTVGAASIIGAGAVVVRDVPPGCVAAGVPARLVRTAGVAGDHRRVEAGDREAGAGAEAKEN